MKLSRENARQLSLLVWKERMRRILPAVLTALILTALLTAFLVNQAERSDPTTAVVAHAATVVTVRPAGRAAAVLHVHLDDGREVDALSTLRLTPVAGAHVVVNDVVHASGRHTFDAVRLAD